MLDDDTPDVEFVNDSQLRVDVPSYAVSSPGSISVRVINPGGRVSDTSTVSITASSGSCDTAGVDVVLDAIGVSKRASVAYSFGPARRFFYSPSEPKYHECPVADLSTAQTPFAGTVVQNTTDSFVFLEATANCASNDDAYLAIYETTSTVPTSDAARKACTGSVASGSSGGGNLSSPNSNGSTSCPGLTKPNGGAVLLLPCEKAVIVTQPFRTDGTGRPSSIDVKIVD